MDYAIVEAGVVANVIVADADFAAGIGAALLPDGFGIGDFFDGTTWTKAPAPAPPPPTADQVNAERDRRIYAGTAIDVAGYGIIPLTGRERDQINLMTLASRAQAMKAAGVTTASMTIRDRDNINHLLTPDHMIQLVASGVAWIEATMKVSWDMKDRAGEFPNGIPADYTDDSYWP